MLFYLTKFGFSSIEFMAELPSIFNYATDVKMRYQLNMLERKIYIAKPNYVVSKQDSIMLKSILEQIAHICIAMMTEKANGTIPDNQWGDIIDVHIAARDNWIICIQKADNIALFIQCFERLRKTLHDCYAKYFSSQTSTVACRRPTRRSNIASDQESTHAAQWSLHYVSLYKWLKWTVLTLAWLSDSALEHKDFVLTMIRKEIKGQGIFGQYTENIEKEHPIIIHWLLGWSTGNLFFINDAGVGFNPVQSITYRTIEWVSDMVEPVVYNFFLRILHAVGMAPTVANTVLMALLICYRLIIRDQMITVFNFITRRLLQVVGYCICTCSDNSFRFVRWFWNLGEKQNIHKVYAIIQNDPRHHQIIKVLDRAILKRDFAYWNFAFRNWSFTNVLQARLNQDEKKHCSEEQLKEFDQMIFTLKMISLRKLK